MAKQEEEAQNAKLPLEATSVASVPPLWELNIKEITGHNLEVAGRDDVNKLLKEGWILLHLYTLKYREDGTWRERPMAILGLPEK